MPLFVLDPYFFAAERAKEMPNRVHFLLESLRELASAIRALGSRLLVVEGKSVEVVPRVARAVRADRVVAHRWSEPFAVDRDRRIAAALGGVPLVLFEGETLARRFQIKTNAGGAYSVFTPFARAFAEVVTIGAPLPAPRSLPPLPRAVAAAVKEAPIPSAKSLGLSPSPGVIAPGADAARRRLRRFLGTAGTRYHLGRDEPGRDGTSRLSQDLKFGTLSVRSVWSGAHRALRDHPKALRSFANELVWREFAYEVMRNAPYVLERPWRSAWEGFPWRVDEAGWQAWIAGTTGYPIVDAAARQLLAEGFVHNRVRMIAASFLAKHLLIDFRRGEAHYLKYLTDGDWANNDLGWQWSVGCGVDAAPYFRVFNPVAQGERFDAEGEYVRRWVPALGALPARWVHRPWEAPAAVLRSARLTLGETYPRPIIGHAMARARFLSVARSHLARVR